MGTARGSQTAFFLYDEDTYGSDPSSPAAKKIYCTNFGLKVAQNLIDDETLTGGDRGKLEPAKGNIDAAGSIAQNLAVEDIGVLLKHLMGAPTTYRPVTNQPTNVTGVTVNRASSGSATGNGTLTFAFAGTTLTWAENGDTAGSTVDVSSDGDYTITSTSGESIYVTVVSASLPGSNQNDADITVGTGYEHLFTIASLPTSFMAEKDHGSNISGSGRFEKFNGCRINQATFTFPQEGYCTASWDVKGSNSTLASSALDGTPDDYGHTSFSAFSGTVKEGGSTIANLTEMTLVVGNDLDDSEYTLGASGVRSGLAEGDAMISGSITGLFRSSALLTKANADTETSLQMTLSRGDGFGTAGNEYIDFQVQQCKYERTSPEVSGPRGVRETYNYRGYKNSSGSQLGLQIIIRNAVASL